jgi:hypothetical protein
LIWLSFDLVRSATRPNAPQVLRLLDYLIFNALISNHDVHAKNFSLLYSGTAPILAPFYDTLSTAVYPTLTPKMAQPPNPRSESPCGRGFRWNYSRLMYRGCCPARMAWMMVALPCFAPWIQAVLPHWSMLPEKQTDAFPLRFQ